MRDRRSQLDMPHTLATDLRECDFNAALLADDAAILHTLVLTAKTFVILDRTEDPGTEQAVPFRFEGPVVDGFRLLDLAEGPREDPIRASD